eukprot:1942659-Rhodomonas_salina.1
MPSLRRVRLEDDAADADADADGLSWERRRALPKALSNAVSASVNRFPSSSSGPSSTSPPRCPRPPSRRALSS